ncbi:hypothetical protein K504DRAFT_461320 [Pleomassaria siparia CBS 279.74]|uniref:Thioesterase domain-containing protein n=1 Tax=Pleomassaria siparia CBS 279.74 TaxID=1314801 RepID=A0A6G1JVI8_9PLEO|nr:hypothetical protein K504DRAFT_461320 [Pleomassaria siparia CBS 279.74]
MYPVARSAFCRRVGPGLGRGLAVLRRSQRGLVGPGPGPGPRLGLGGFNNNNKEEELVSSSVVVAGRRGRCTRAAFASGHVSLLPVDDGKVLRALPPISRARRAGYIFALTLAAFTLGFAMAASPALSSATAFLNPPSDAETLTTSHFVPPTPEVAEIERQIFKHPITRALLQDEKYVASRPHLKIPEKLRAQNLTGGTLLGPDKIAVPVLQFVTADGSTYVSFQWLGPALCGHPGIVHGGLLATLLDEGLARCCFPALPNKVAVTASLKLEYKRPCMAGQIVMLKAETTRVEGRKAWVTGRLMTLPKDGEDEGVVLTEGEALFIEPRQAATMKRVVN